MWAWFKYDTALSGVVQTRTAYSLTHFSSAVPIVHRPTDRFDSPKTTKAVYTACDAYHPGCFSPTDRPRSRRLVFNRSLCSHGILGTIKPSWAMYKVSLCEVAFRCSHLASRTSSGVGRNLNWHEGACLPSPSLPFLSFPSFSSSPTLLFSSLFPSLPLLRSMTPKCQLYRGFGGALWAPAARSGAESQLNRIWCRMISDGNNLNFFSSPKYLLLIFKNNWHCVSGHCLRLCARLELRNCGRRRWAIAWRRQRPAAARTSQTGPRLETTHAATTSRHSRCHRSSLCLCSRRVVSRHHARDFDFRGGAVLIFSLYSAVARPPRVRWSVELSARAGRLYIAAGWSVLDTKKRATDRATRGGRRRTSCSRQFSAEFDASRRTARWSDLDVPTRSPALLRPSVWDAPDAAAHRPCLCD